MKNSVIVIAEAGVNHNGSLDTAFELIKIAARAGADYVKFQSFNANSLVSKKSKLANYQIQNTKETELTQFEMLKKLEIKKGWYQKLISKCEENGIGFLSTGFDEYNIDLIVKLGIDFIKIPSGEITNKPLLTHISKKNKNIILSTGMSTINEISKAIKLITSNGLTKKNIILLHCNTEYPTPYCDVNLNAMNHLKNEFNVNVGYSDHTLGIEIPISAAALGAKIIEKHFTIDKYLDGPDHLISLDEKELTQMIKSIRNIELSIGSKFKKVTDSEKKNLIPVRKSIHIKRKVKSGKSLTTKDLIMLRPGDGISPMEIDKIIGRVVSKDLNEGDKLKLSHLL